MSWFDRLVARARGRGPVADLPVLPPAPIVVVKALPAPLMPSRGAPDVEIEVMAIEGEAADDVWIDAYGPPALELPAPEPRNISGVHRRVEGLGDRTRRRVAVSEILRSKKEEPTRRVSVDSYQAAIEEASQRRARRG